MTRHQIICPRCRQRTVYAESNRWRPFCSERCRMIDLGAWASEAFRVPAESPADADSAPAAPLEPRRLQ